MSKKHSKGDKELDFQVVTLLQQSGIFNQVRAETLTSVAKEVQSSSLDSMKNFKDIKTDDDDYSLASEMVFEYLKRHNMTNTIQCIQTETENQLRQVPISNKLANNLGISEKDNVLHHVISNYFNNIDAIFESYHQDLVNKINDRLQNIGKNKPPQPSKPKAQKSQTISPASKPTTPANQADQHANTQKQVPAKKEESSSEIDFDLNDDDLPAPTKATTKTDTKANTQQPKKPQSESSDLNFDDFDDFDNANTSPKKTDKPAAKPAVTKTSSQSVKTVGDSEPFDSFDDADFNDNVPPSPKNDKSPNSYKPKNEVDDFLEDDDEPPLLNQAQSKTPPKNDDTDFDDIDIDSLSN